MGTMLLINISGAGASSASRSATLSTAGTAAAFGAPFLVSGLYRPMLSAILCTSSRDNGGLRGDRVDWRMYWLVDEIEAAGLKPQLAAEPAEKQEKKWVSKPMCGHAALLDEPADLIVLGLPIGGELHLLHRHTGPESCVPLVPPWGQRWGQRKRLFRKKIGPFYWACPTVLLRTALL